MYSINVYYNFRGRIRVEDIKEHKETLEIFYRAHVAPDVATFDSWPKLQGSSPEKHDFVYFYNHAALMIRCQHHQTSFLLLFFTF